VSCGLFSQMKMKIEIKLAGLPLRLRLEHAETAAYFEPYTLPDADADVDLYVTAEDFARDGGPLSDAPGAFQEYSLLVAASSRCLLRHGRVVYHGVAVKLGGRAWLITAPSGTGKTTQYKWLKTLYREKVSLICGDKPILERRGERVYVHPSPWPGKERFPGGPGGALAGIVLLEQAQENTVSRLTAREAVFPLFREFLYVPEMEEEAREVGRMAEAMLRLPVWKLRNRGDEASARLLYETVTEYETI